MKNLMQQFNEQLRGQGRYGIDAFSRTLLICALPTHYSQVFSTAAP